MTTNPRVITIVKGVMMSVRRLLYHFLAVSVKWCRGQRVFLRRVAMEGADLRGVDHQTKFLVLQAAKKWMRMREWSELGSEVDSDVIEG